MAEGGRPIGSDRERSELQELARLHGVETVHRDGFDREVRPDAETLLAVLRSLDVPVEAMADVPEELRARRAERERRLVDPVVVVWEGGTTALSLGPAVATDEEVEVRIRTETGESLEWRARPRGGGEVPVRAGSWSGPGREPPAVPHVPLADPLPRGFHHLEVQAGERAASGLLVVAPARFHAAPGSGGDDAADVPRGRSLETTWGAFLPLYALRHEGDWGVGDLSGFGTLLESTGRWGAGVVGTLPLFAAFLDGPVDPSPYAPVSRLFWNELYLDPRRLPEWETATEARELVASPGFQETLERLRGHREVDYAEAARARHRVLDLLARRWEDDGGPVPPEVERYARFRAAVHRLGPPGSGHGWRDAWRSAELPRSAGDERIRLRHLYAQLRFPEQLREARAAAGEDAAGLYLDLPLGANPAGFDVWDRPGLFADGARIGAPPDGFNPAGQDWGLPPLNPEASRREGHGHLRRVFGTIAEHAEVLRVDHVMGLHRLYWVPQGGDARRGAYVRYGAEELYALLSLVSHRRRTVLAGEDLGTVPPEVRAAMDAVGMRRSYVVPFEVETREGSEEGGGLAAVPRGAVASLNTHDLPPFASFWRGLDIRERVERGELEEGEAGAEEAWRRRCRTILARIAGAEGDEEAEAAAVLPGLLRWLGRSEAGLVLVNLEDLWLEERPQNRPGTTDPGNWRGRARRSLEDLARDPGILDLFEELRNARAGEGR